MPRRRVRPSSQRPWASTTTRHIPLSCVQQVTIIITIVKTSISLKCADSTLKQNHDQVSIAIREWDHRRFKVECHRCQPSRNHAGNPVFRLSSRIFAKTSRIFCFISVKIKIATIFSATKIVCGQKLCENARDTLQQCF